MTSAIPVQRSYQLSCEAITGRTGHFLDAWKTNTPDFNVIWTRDLYNTSTALQPADLLSQDLESRSF